jgi:hypothetical protein
MYRRFAEVLECVPFPLPTSVQAVCPMNAPTQITVAKDRALILATPVVGTVQPLNLKTRRIMVDSTVSPPGLVDVKVRQCALQPLRLQKPTMPPNQWPSVLTSVLSPLLLVK